MEHFGEFQPQTDIGRAWQDANRVSIGDGGPGDPPEYVRDETHLPNYIDPAELLKNTSEARTPELHESQPAERSVTPTPAHAPERSFGDAAKDAFGDFCVTVTASAGGTELFLDGHTVLGPAVALTGLLNAIRGGHLIEAKRRYRARHPQR